MLNGPWAFTFDDDDRGLADCWQDTAASALEQGASPFDRTIVVPFAWQSPLSGIGDVGHHEVAWYARVLPAVERGERDRLLLHIGASDHETTVWVNGRQVAHHVGGYTPFTADLTNVVTGDGDVCVVRVHDGVLDLDKPRGKQYWQEQPAGVFYTATSGIWQSVWLEVVHEAAIDHIAIRTLVDSASIDLVARVTPAAVGNSLDVRVSLDGHVLASDKVALMGPEIRRRIRLTEVEGIRDERMIAFDGLATWTPWTPTLHDIELDVVAQDGTVVDHVESYFGMRTIEVRDGRVVLNGLPLFQRLVLDQGYFPQGGYTAREDADLRGDIELAKELGFIGCRKHQKVEDPRWLYWADRLGFLVWSELPSAHRFSDRAVRRSTQLWQEVIARDRNHPCIVVWVPMNESWGAPSVRSGDTVEQVHHLRLLHHLTKALDPTRLVVSNDGWEHAETDLLTVHEYGDAEALRDRFSSRTRALDPARARRSSFAIGHHDEGVPIVLSEFGGISMADDPGWGFHVTEGGAGLVRDLEAFVGAVVATDVAVGFCWTQLTDVEQETNGLVTADRRPKAPVEYIRDAVTQSRPAPGLQVTEP